MHTLADKAQENKSQSVTNTVSEKQREGVSNFSFADNRPEAFAYKKMKDLANKSPYSTQLKAMQKMANNATQANLHNSLPIQRAIDSTEKPALGDLVKRHTSVPDTYNAICDSATFNVVIMEAARDDASGVTTALLLDSENEIVLHINSGAALQGLTADQIKNTAKVDVGVTISSRRANYATQAIQAQDESGRIMTILHEFERHVYPFFKLWDEMLNAQVADLTVGDEEENEEMVALLGKTGNANGEYNAETQHKDPVLSKNTIFAVFNAISAGQGNRTKLLFQACADTIGRGVSLALVEAEVPPEILQYDLWKEFSRLALFMQGAERRQAKGDFSEDDIDEEVLIVEGAYMGMFGKISDDSFMVVGEQEVDPSPADLIIQVGRDYAVMPPSYLMIQPD